LDYESKKGSNRTPTRKNSDFMLDINLPEKDELLYQDPEISFREYEDFLMINGEKL